MDNKDNLPTLPKGWMWSGIDEILEKVSLTGRKLQQKEYQDKGNLPVIDQGQNYIGGYTDRNDLKIVCAQPAIIFGDHTKMIKYVPFDFVAGADGVKVIRPIGIFYPKLFYYFLQVVPLPDKGYARHFQFLEKENIPIPPIAEQHRIVAKIEELFTRLDAGTAALKKVKAELKRYRQAVLKYAFEGKLTAAWREANKDKIEPASVLLERITEERKKAATGKLKDLPPVDTIGLPELPEGWACFILQKIIEKIPLSGKKLQQREYQESGLLPVIDQGQNYIGGYTDRDDLKIACDQPVIVFGDHTKVFKYVSFDFVAGADGIKVFRPLDSFYPKLFYYFLQALPLPDKGYARHFQYLEKSRLPLPPLPEQHSIVQEIERRFSVAEEVEKVVDQSLKQSERLRQSILKKAFEGKLVPQDPSDEPADKLLERIKAEKAKLEAEVKVKKAAGKKPLKKKASKKQGRLL